MSLIQEREPDIIVKYILVRKFQYHHPDLTESFAGHPAAGKVYRSVYNVNSKHHRLILPDGVYMGFNQLVGSSEGADFELEEITIENILDFDIKEEDLEIFLQSNDDLFIESKMTTADNEEINFSQRASEAVLGLYNINSLKGEILVRIANCLIELEMVSHEDGASDLRFHPDHGAGVNISDALRALGRYTSPNKKIGGEEGDLFIALESIITELERVY